MPQIPPSTKPYFQEYLFDQLDPVTYRTLVIGRLLAYGDRDEIRWLYQTYGRGQLRQWVTEDGVRLLPRLRYNLWCVVFEIQPDVKTLKERIWPH